MKRLPLDTARYDTRATLSCYSCSVQFHPLHVLLLPFKTLCALACTARGPSQSLLHCPQGCTAPPSPPLLPAPLTEHCSGPLKRPNPGPLVASLFSAQCSVLSAPGGTRIRSAAVAALSPAPPRLSRRPPLPPRPRPRPCPRPCPRPPPGSSAASRRQGRGTSHGRRLRGRGRERGRDVGGDGRSKRKEEEMKRGNKG